MARGIVAREARDRDELEQALRLVHNRYVECGYMEPTAGGIRLSPHHALPSTRCCVALLGDEVISTTSVFLDSRLGLPLDGLYIEQLDSLRRCGRKLAEVGMLADRRDPLGRGVREVLRLMRVVFWGAASGGVDDLVIGVNPRHAAFYQRLLCFVRHGPVLAYPSVGNAPAVLLRLNISDLQPSDVADQRIRELFFAPPTPEESAGGYRMRQEDLEYFFIEKTDLFARLGHEARLAIEDHYPGLKIADLVRPFAVA